MIQLRKNSTLLNVFDRFILRIDSRIELMFRNVIAGSLSVL